MGGCEGPQISAEALEEVLDDGWNWEDVGIDNIADLLRYIEASNITVQQFMQLNLYAKNVDKVAWLKELEKQKEQHHGSAKRQS